ncbi:phenol 2-monooxygenase [Rhizorhabdus wittichii DC-6]|nr:phenol 2-monooxygenase [Rhizorhabdus wittichii DC-6]
MAKTVETDVLVVGAGPAGAISALLLSTYGIRTIMINKYGSTSPGPRAHITNQRAMEILRDLDLEEPAKALAVPQEKMGHLFARSLVDEEFGRIYSWSTHPEAKARHDLASPCAICDLPQYYFEPLVTAQCALRGSDVRLRTEYVSHVQDADGVTATLRDLLTDTDYQVRAKYLIGADGARSKVAQDIGLPFEGRMATGDSGSLNIEFTADLSALVQHRPSDMFWLLQTGSGLNGTGVGVLRMVRPWHKWVCVWGYELANGAPQLSTEQARAIVQKLIGTDDIPVTIDGMSTWTINQQYAGRNSAGRVFCMGDAVHRHSPMGGLGLNTSVQDAYNLAWKLAAVIKGQAGAELLASFDAERSPIAKQIVDYTASTFATLPPMFAALGIPPAPTEQDMDLAIARLKEPTEDAAGRRKALRKAIDETIVIFGGGHGVEMNQRYRSGAIVSDGSEDPGFARDERLFHQPSTRPGAHLPHAWLTSDHRRVSTLDLCGKGRFTLLTGLAGSAWAKDAEEVRRELGIDLRVHVIGPGQPYEDAWGDFAAASEVGESGLLLVRPDMFVAWRAADAADAGSGRLLEVMRTILHAPEARSREPELAIAKTG